MSFGDGFKECAACAGRDPGLTPLCEVCLHNRALEAERDGWRRDCIAAVGRAQGLERMIAKARKALRAGGETTGGAREAYRALDLRARR